MNLFLFSTRWIAHRRGRAVHPDAYANHKSEHERLLDDIQDIMEDYERGAYEDAEAVLAERLRRWFGGHFTTKDVR